MEIMLLIFILIILLVVLLFIICIARIVVKQSSELAELFEEMKLQRLGIRQLLNWMGGERTITRDQD